MDTMSDLPTFFKAQFCPKLNVWNLWIDCEIDVYYEKDNSN